MHSFDPEIAKIVGVNAAVIYQNLVWWTQKNAANERHYYDGRYWTYNSVKAFDSLFPYLTAKQIRTALEKLEQANLIVSGNFNQSAYDRTKWYSPNEQIHLPNVETPFAQKGKPIPDSKPHIKPDTSNKSSGDDAPVSEQEIIECWNDLAERTGLAKIKVMNDKRRNTLRKRIKECPDVETWALAFRNIEQSSFLLGDNDRGWQANFDFLLQPTSFMKIIEGNY